MGRQVSRQFNRQPARQPIRQTGRPRSLAWISAWISGMSVPSWTLMVALVAILGLGACSTGPSDPGEGEGESDGSVEEFEGDLVFEDVNLSRADDDGKPLWTVKADEARYSRDREKGELKAPKGKLYQDGKAVYEVQAKQGFVEQNGVILKLAGDIKVKDLRDKSTFEGQKGRWQPQLGVFELEEGVVLNRGSDRLTAKSGQAFSKERNFILKDEVKLVSLKDKKNPAAGKTELTTNELIWQMGPNQVDAAGSPKLKQVDGKNQTTTTLEGERVVWLRKKQLIQVVGQGKAKQLKPKEQTALQGDRLVWQQKDQVIQAIGKGQVQQVAPNQNTDLRAERLVWQQKDQVIQAMGNARVKQLEGGQTTDLRAQQLVWQRKEQVLRAEGNVVAVGQGDGVRVQTQRAILQQKEGLWTSDVPTVMERYDCSSGTCVVSDRASSNRVDMRMAEQVVFLRGNAKITLADPALDATSESMAWHMKDQRLIADQPVTVVNKTDGVVLQGNYGDVDMKAQVANLVGNVRGRSQQNQSRMRSERLFWAMKEEQVQLVGNVFYQQADPPLTSTGDRAAAALKDGVFVLLSGPGQRARTTFVTEETTKAEPKPTPAPSAAAPAIAPAPSPVPSLPPLPARPGDLPAIPRDQLLGRQPRP